MFVCGLLMVFRKAINFWMLILFPKTLLKSFFLINMCQHFFVNLYASRKNLFFVGQLKYLFLVGKFSRKKKKERIRHRKKEQSGWRSLAVIWESTAWVTSYPGQVFILLKLIRNGHKNLLEMLTLPRRRVWITACKALWPRSFFFYDGITKQICQLLLSLISNLFLTCSLNFKAQF